MFINFSIVLVLTKISGNFYAKWKCELCNVNVWLFNCNKLIVQAILCRVVQYGGGWGATLPHPGVVPPHEDLSPPIPKILSPPPR